MYLDRSRRRTLILDSGHSMAKWEEMVENYLGFPEGLSGSALLERSRRQALQFGAVLVEDDVRTITRDASARFVLRGREDEYRARRVLLEENLADHALRVCAPA